MPTTRRGWLQEGLAILEETGSEALTIEALIGRLKVTKGSFYHHFKHFQDFQFSLLLFFEEERTRQIIQLAEQETSPQEKMEFILHSTLNPSRLEVAIRAWAFQDALVQDSLQRIDQQRLAYLEKLIYAQTDDQKYAFHMARLFYSIYVGSQHILPPMQGENLARLYREAQRLLVLPLKVLESDK